MSKVRARMSGRLFLETLLISLAAILLEVSYTRIFSFKVVYYFAYVVIGLALLGLGAGGVFVAMFPGLRRRSPGRLLPAYCLAGGAAVLGGYLVVARLPLNLFQVVNAAPGGEMGPVAEETAKLALVCLVLLGPFLAAGLALATIFSTRARDIARLYFADLLGAAIGCALSVPLIVLVSPPGAVLLAGFCLSAAGLRLASAHARALVLPLAALAVVELAGGALFPSWLPDVLPDRIKLRANPGNFFRWSPVFRVDVLPMPDPRIMFLVHDGTIGSSMWRFDGDLGTLAELETDERSTPFRLLGPGRRVAIVGSAGGREILASLYFGAADVTAIELNPVTVSLLTTHFADYTGRLAERPDVHLVNAEGRSFLAGAPGRYDLVWYVAPDTYAAMNAAASGAFVLSESYLYTVEMIEEALRHLGPDGIVCAQFGEIDFDRKPNRTTRYLATAREAFRRLGVEDFERHALVGTALGLGTLRTSTVLLKPAPFTAVDVERFVAATARVTGAQVRFAPDRSVPEGPVGRVIRLPPAELDAFYRGYPFLVRPVTDDAPFFWHFVRFRDALRGWRQRAANVEEGVGERLLLLLLGVTTALAALVLLAPLVAGRAVWRAVPCKTRAGVYFAALGVGFMFLEISLIQRFTLFLGYPTYSLTVTLFALLVSTGVGSLVSERWLGRRNLALVVLGAGVLALVLFYARGLPPVLARGMAWSLALRVAFTVAVLAPLGLCLGAFMPLGLRTVAALTQHAEEFVAWSWAVNGFFSVVSSVLATVLSMALGFDRVMLAGVGVYALGIVALLGVPAPGEGR